MIKFVVIGDPVAHSRSPGMQNMAFERAGLGRPYGRRHVTRDGLAAFVAEAKKSLAGVNITVPHKEAVIPFLDAIDPAAARCGSVNTLDIRDGKVRGFSTDGYGLEYALKENFDISPAGTDFCFIGCGGACRATALHLAESGARSIHLVNRTLAKAEAAAGNIARFAPGCRVSVHSLNDGRSVEEAIAGSGVLIQATSLGLSEEDPPPFDPELLRANPGIAVFDTIYKKTRLLRAAEALHLRCAGGKSMLIHQGAASFRIWTGREPDLEAMRSGFDITPVTDGDGEE
ncbi:MAG: shikimate dehydrogenase [Lentisphaeria bacterium]|nr:shikimate dehydrogenase [Lentisphaeria bacterium]